MNPNACGKSANLYSRWSLPSCTFQPGSLATPADISASVIFFLILAPAPGFYLRLYSASHVEPDGAHQLQRVTSWHNSRTEAVIEPYLTVLQMILAVNG